MKYDVIVIGAGSAGGALGSNRNPRRSPEAKWSAGPTPSMANASRPHGGSWEWLELPHPTPLESGALRHSVPQNEWSSEPGRSITSNATLVLL